MSDHDESTALDDVDQSTPADFLDHEPTLEEKIEMRKALKSPSEWLKLLCHDWAMDNEVLVETTDAKFLDYKPFLKGLLSSQLLCRLSIPPNMKPVFEDGSMHSSLEFWFILGIIDEFDRAYIVAQIERFCALYSIRAISLGPLEMDTEHHLDSIDAASIAAAAAAELSASPSTVPYIDPTATAAAAAASDIPKLSRKQAAAESRAQSLVRQNAKREQRRLLPDKKYDQQRMREERAAQRANERAEREASREDSKRRRLTIRLERELFVKQQKDAAFRRAADLVASNRVPIEITRGAAAARAAQAVIQATSPRLRQPLLQEDSDLHSKKKRSAISVSTAADLHEIVTHANNLYAKYSAIAKEHNQKVSWITVARELGMHVKVREKYARMHARATYRGFNWERFGNWKIKNHPEIFMEPTQEEQKAKMPPPPPDVNRTVMIDGTREVTDDVVAAAVAVVDASVNNSSVDTTHEQSSTGGVGAATLVADPTAASYEQFV